MTATRKRRVWTREQLMALLEQHGTQYRAAKAVGVDRGQFCRMLKRHGIETKAAETYGNDAWKAIGP